MKMFALGVSLVAEDARVARHSAPVAQSGLHWEYHSLPKTHDVPGTQHLSPKLRPPHCSHTFPHATSGGDVGDLVGEAVSGTAGEGGVPGGAADGAAAAGEVEAAPAPSDAPSEGDGSSKPQGAVAAAELSQTLTDAFNSPISDWQAVI